MSTEIDLSKPPISEALYHPQSGRWVALAQDLAAHLKVADSNISRAATTGQIRRHGRFFDVLDALEVRPGSGRKGPRLQQKEAA